MALKCNHMTASEINSLLGCLGQHFMWADSLAPVLHEAKPSNVGWDKVHPWAARDAGSHGKHHRRQVNPLTLCQSTTWLSFIWASNARGSKVTPRQGSYTQTVCIRFVARLPPGLCLVLMAAPPGVSFIAHANIIYCQKGNKCCAGRRLKQLGL